MKISGEIKNKTGQLSLEASFKIKNSKLQACVYQG